MTFARVIANRAIDLTFVLFGVSIIVFLMIRMIPGDAVAIMLGANTEITPERLAELYRRLGLDKPLVVQYFDWVTAALSGDLGRSIWTGAPVIEEITARLPVTLELLALSLAFAVILSVPAGCIMAYVRGGAADTALRIATIAGVTIPNFWFGIVMLYLFAVVLPSWPALGWVPLVDDPIGNLQRLTLPVLALSLPILAGLSRIVRTAMLDALGQDYIRTARAKGVSERSVIYKHALRNALIPFVTTVGIMAGYLFGGAIVVEQVFALPGLGRLIIGAINERNYPLIQAAILLVTCSFVAINFLVDLLYVAIDPRIRRR